MEEQPGRLITGDALLGMSYGWWVMKHNRHHASPNNLDVDPDVNNLAIAYSRDQALERRGPMRWLAAYQAFLFFSRCCSCSASACTPPA